MTALSEDAELIRYALAYVIALNRELTGENGAPTLGTQNQAVNFILADPELSAAITEWGRKVKADEATIEPQPRLPYDAAFQRVVAFLRSRIDEPVYARRE